MVYIAQKKKKRRWNTEPQEGKKTLFIALVASNALNMNEMEFQWERYYVVRWLESIVVSMHEATNR